MMTIAIPKGRLLPDIQSYFAERNMAFEFIGRKLLAEGPGGAGGGTVAAAGAGAAGSGGTDADKHERIRWILVKNSDVPTYVDRGIATLGIVGSDVLDESRRRLFRHFAFPFGKAKLCLINRKDAHSDDLHNGVRIASKYPVASGEYLAHLGISGTIHPLNGSLELAPLLALAPFIIDIVQTSETLKSNQLKVCDTIAQTNVWLISNPAYYKVNYKSVDNLIEALQQI